MKTRSHEFSVETSAGAEQSPDFVESSPPKYMFEAGHFPQQLSYVKCYETGPRRWARLFTEVRSMTVLAFYCHLVCWKRTIVISAYVACHVHGFHLIKCPNHLFQSVLQNYQNSQSLWYYSYKCEMGVLSLILIYIRTFLLLLLAINAPLVKWSLQHLKWLITVAAN